MSVVRKKVCILGWYGTETLGDRAILDGIFSLFYKAYGKCDFYIGSLYTFFTERTLLEDGEIYKKNAPECTITLFDVKERMSEFVKMSDIVIMGGGPIMELDLLYLIYKGFRIAKKIGKKTIIFGCGLGPLKTKRLIGVARKLITIADLVIFRDEESLKYSYEIIGSQDKYYALDDPAIISVQQYKKSNNNKKQNYLAINMREPDHHYPHLEGNIIADFCELVRISCSYYEQVKLVPMHTFSVGKDDRRYLAQIAAQVNDSKVEVLHKPLSLYELYEVYEKAAACIGMRYHSVVLQTILNGNNYIMDYTEKNTGKISGFIKMLNNHAFYDNRYTSIISEKIEPLNCMDILTENKYFKYNVLNGSEQKYCSLLKDLYKSEDIK